MRTSIASGKRLIGVCCGLAIAAIAVADAAFAQRTTAPQFKPAPPASLLPDPQPAAAARGPQSDPRIAAIAAEQANRLMRERKFSDALAVLEPALKTSPRDPQLRFLYGVSLAELGRAPDATLVFEQMTLDFPELPEPYNNLAVMYALAGNLDKARGALEGAVRALPGYALAHENLGDVYLRLAARSWERAAGLDAQSESARGKLELARQMLARVPPPAGGGTAAPPAASPTTSPTPSPTASPPAASPPAVPARTN